MCRTSEAWIHICFLAWAAGPAPGFWSTYGRDANLLSLSCPPCMGTADPCHPPLPHSLSPKASAYSHHWREAAEQDRLTAGPTHTPEPWTPWLVKAKPRGGKGCAASLAAGPQGQQLAVPPSHSVTVGLSINTQQQAWRACKFLPPSQTPSQGSKPERLLTASHQGARTPAWPPQQPPTSRTWASLDGLTLPNFNQHSYTTRFSRVLLTIAHETHLTRSVPL